ncbi:type II secretion system protein [Phormidium tenue FACHB-886]|nr:type II secretion system protein [Phormidium tenue FACHB-886]
MAKTRLLTRLKSRLRQALLPSRQASSKGFTLLELLVVMLIASSIIAGLMYIVVELMGTDQRESSRSETQREMQMALDYMSTELREAVFVYSAANLECAGPAGNCQPLTNYLPTSLSNNSVPILAFWKQEPFPNQVPAGSVRARCFGATSTAPPGVSCLTGHSYALVVYSLSKNNSNIWSARNARITRYILKQFNSDGNLTPGYVNPGAYTNTPFSTWPIFKNDVGVDTNFQTERPDGPPVTLVDFVDAQPQPRAAGSGGGVSEEYACPNANPTDPTSYTYALTPSLRTLESAGFAKVRSFYACVSITPGLPVAQQIVNPSENQEIILHLQGNANGRPGIFRDELLSALETRVLSRGVLTKRPE